ncbi:MAG: hypothetical protein ABSE82_00065 [Nitrososphaerales archaeon]|jgi:hypothetical protein
MRTIFVIVGVVILVLGVFLFAAGALIALGSTTIINTFNEQQTGEYVSTELVMNTTSVVVVTSPVSNGGLIQAQDLALVNSSSVSSYALTPRSTAGGTETYRDLTGSYYYVIFSSAQPSSRIVVTGGQLSKAVGVGFLVLGGIVLFIAGIIVAIVGAMLKKRPPATPPPDPYYQNAQKQQ